ncbi:formimidoylglutamase [Commensalibacter nepenthis]|uniref:Formimidoylglutamase n=1 Tax=Commensalibacter nepenthis TaxID=3043872 RepID=A0ABT6QAL3_9PROT|nr:formimidoylglutamase [Commensalibacter sp. TBRC 10068]MDI2113821.1 formimidoylglutamase [Commensalibacter sp. TBRC 10068]
MAHHFWKATEKNIWSGRNDREEGPSALRLFQIIKVAKNFLPNHYLHHIAFMGFMCDEGVRLNKGRVGAANAPDILRKSLGNLAAHTIHQIVDFGNILFNQDLNTSQQYLAQSIKECQNLELKTLVLGGGHETAYGHGLGIYQSHIGKKIGIINFDAHLDLRNSSTTSSGTPFKQLAHFCQQQDIEFNYLCIGASLASNTQSLLETAHKLNVHIIWDTECHFNRLDFIQKQLHDFIKAVDIIYLTIDLDVLPLSIMSAVSAPAAYGVDLSILLTLAEEIKATNKLKAVDFVEFNPDLDKDGLCARVAARFIWQILFNWK